MSRPLDVNTRKHEEANQASWEACKGALSGAFKWGVASAMLGGLGYAVSPMYRGFTIQFKVYIQMSGMVLGGMLEADHRIREYEKTMRMRRRIAADQAMWKQFEETYGKDEDDE
ncbi:hypothetical protein GE21DRAFT_7726 [Neurospora crassa]|uniref:Imidazoleglycerol-phosphate dehydratase n=5 Tax=Neurospora TaxID=5140 RepID=Q1K7W6_NEUCR|nr:uncharacterized protein NEUTE1DRAFT_76222 [Neurospora tetrasperma FGSC 2508]XP_961385.1 hypothetical protein NCU01299 [Neurospora crassa OR74A]EGZ75231.1 hypothetical protein NEUTE2DRAFT_83369 [Neurospora tetrasperma FGSC 2509]KAK3491351.1 hypothetical protein B0T13DRAFT_450843 [Neurospora crassa]KAK3499656.1 hypothetical protein B0T23DRAFT_22952 [Neurospora hispaniola]EAA32149.1 hypothetical protein NCU01299 [Neurospora crassa OR74A]EGO60781.1 hypothetical protein NEUTE1DRAFT_76222 [Neuro|eukprot:XP_961385.1 hypothetical protein NCU01299 [Neurospora crassa OR74A]